MDRQFDEFAHALNQLIADHGLQFPVHRVLGQRSKRQRAGDPHQRRCIGGLGGAHSENEKFGPPLNIMVVSQTNNKTLLVTVERDRGMVL